MDAVLWRTRGKDWGYCFLLVPEELRPSGAFEIWNQVFAAERPTVTEHYVFGRAARSLQYVGVTFEDTERRDRFGRPICHYVMWFFSDTDPKLALETLPVDWGHAFVDAMGGAPDAETEEEARAIAIQYSLSAGARVGGHWMSRLPTKQGSTGITRQRIAERRDLLRTSPLKTAPRSLFIIALLVLAASLILVAVGRELVPGLGRGHGPSDIR